MFPIFNRENRFFLLINTVTIGLQKNSGWGQIRGGSKETGNENPNGKGGRGTNLKNLLPVHWNPLPYLYSKHTHARFTRCFSTKIEWEEQWCKEVISWYHCKCHPARGSVHSAPQGWLCLPRGSFWSCSQLKSHQAFFLVFLLTGVICESSKCYMGTCIRTSATNNEKTASGKLYRKTDL